MNVRVKVWSVLLLAVLLINCRDEEVFTSDPSQLLTFSLDTLRFDTVFTQRGSATQIFKLYNDHSESLRINNIRMGRGEDSKFRFNVDGFKGPLVENLEIGPKDSTYAFVEVTIDPNEPLSVSPFIIEEKMIFETNGVEQVIEVEAWGQNANYLPALNQNNAISVLSCDQGVIDFDDPRPYVIFGAFIIDSCTVRMAEGTRIYVHGGLGMVSEDFIFNGGFILIGSNGTIECNGSLENPIVWSTDRLEESYQDDGGQWAGIRIAGGSTGNVFTNTTIRNSIIGLEVDSSASVVLDKTQIHTTSGNGLTGIQANILAQNCLFANNQGSAFVALQGGNYEFEHCTFANYGTDQSAIGLSNFRCLDLPGCNQAIAAPLNFTAKNSIVHGSSEDQILLSAADGVDFNYNFDHCIVKTDEIIDDFPDFFDHCNECFEPNFRDPLFTNIDETDYTLDTLSVAIDRGVTGVINDDIIGFPRSGTPDLGCYEYQD